MPRKVMIRLTMTTVLLTGCGAPPGPAPVTPSATLSSTPPAPSESTPSAPRRAKGGGPDDVNGDGRADLVADIMEGPGHTRHLVTVYGSARGLDPGRATVISAGTFSSSVIDYGIRADFDGDGFGDVLGYGRRQGDREDRQRPYVFWGGRRGLSTTPTPVPVPVESEMGTYRAVAGDFNGDGRADMAMSTPAPGEHEDLNLAILYGPFTRAAEPARQTVQPSPTGGSFWHMTVDRIDGRRPTDLIVYEGDDGEQTSGRLLEAGRGGLAKEGRRLNKGLAAAFGDFDGDGGRDVAIGDDGSRNNEPPYEIEAPTTDKTLTVYYGTGRTETFKVTRGPLVAGDFDGDGRDDLAFGGGSEHTAGPQGGDDPVRLFWGAQQGLREGGGIEGLGKAVPFLAGDYDGDGADELAFSLTTDGFTLIVTDGRKILTRFPLPPR